MAEDSKSGVAVSNHTDKVFVINPINCVTTISLDSSMGVGVIDAELVEATSSKAVKFEVEL